MGKLCVLPAGTVAPGGKTFIFIRHGESEFNLACTDSSGKKGSKSVVRTMLSCAPLTAACAAGGSV